MIDETLHKKLKSVQREPHKNSGELMCTGRVNSFCSSTSGTRHATSVTNPVVNSCVPEG